MPKLPKHPDETTLLREIKDLKKRLQALEGQTRAESTSVGRGGMQIKEGGDLSVVDSGGEKIGWIGYIGNYPTPQGDPQPGLAFYRNDDSGNTLAFSLLDWNSTDGDGFHQVLRFLDQAGNALFEDDPQGYGLNNPFMPLCLSTAGATTDSGYPGWGVSRDKETEVIVASGRGILQNPRVAGRFAYNHATSENYAWSVRVSYWNNSGDWVTETAWSATLPGGTGASYFDFEPTDPDIGTEVWVDLRARCGGSSGASAVAFGKFNWCYGVGRNYRAPITN